MNLCNPCNIAKINSAYTMFCPSCLACGVRLIQRLGQLPIASSECSARRKAALAVWVQWGHSEAQIRELVKGPLCIGPLTIAAPTGLVAPTACANPLSPKSRSRGRK